MKNLPSLTLDDVRACAPAAFSAAAHPRTSGRYALYKTSDILEDLVKEGWQITRANQSAIHTQSQRDFSCHLVGVSRPELVFENEQIEALFINSNDGRSKYHMELGVYSFACSNGLVDASEHFGEMDLRHFGYIPEQVQEASWKVIERVPKVLSVIKDWKAKELPWVTQYELADFALQLRYPGVHTPIPAEELLNRRRREDSGNSLWTVFNVVQENLLQGGQHYEKLTGRGQRTLRIRPIRSIGTNLSINRTLWNAAEAIYEEKGLVLPA